MKAAPPYFLVLACIGFSVDGQRAYADDKNLPAPAATREYAQKYFHSFKGDAAKKDYYFVGPDAKQCVKFEPEGLRITLPPGRPPQTDGTGVCTSALSRFS